MTVTTPKKNNTRVPKVAAAAATAKGGKTQGKKKKGAHDKLEWEDYCRLLRAFKRKFRHVNVPIDYKSPKRNGIPLGRWAQNQVHAHLIWRTLSHERWWLLQDLGFSFVAAAPGCSESVAAPLAPPPIPPPPTLKDNYALGHRRNLPSKKKKERDEEEDQKLVHDNNNGDNNNNNGSSLHQAAPAAAQEKAVSLPPPRKRLEWDEYYQLLLEYQAEHQGDLRVPHSYKTAQGVSAVACRRVCDFFCH
jgi:Helicase associated domain